jgi:hypothetical protein
VVLRAFVLAALLWPAIGLADVDWAKGLVTAPGVGLADRQAPNPAVARGPARRRAEDAARAALAAQLPALALAGGGTLKDKLVDAAVKARVDAAVAGAFVITADPETDGSWKVTMAVGLDAIRQAVAGGTRQLAGSDEAPPAAIVEGAAVTPALGYTIGGLAAATVFVTEVPAWAKGAPRIKAKGTTGAAIEADVGKATAATLFVIVLKK